MLRKASIANIFASTSEHTEIFEYDDDFSKRVDFNANVSTGLSSAINKDDIDIYFQKIIDSKTGEVIYYEALSRWTSDKLGFIPPNVFFSVALINGMNDILDEYMIDKTFRVYSNFIKENKVDRNTKLTINLSGTALYKYNIDRFILNKALKYNLDPKKIVLEISETTFIRNIDDCIVVINKLKTYGFSIAIDDFGSEYSSIGILEKIPFDILKLDGMFTQNITDNSMFNLVKTITANMFNINKKIVVEKVETKEEADLFNKLGCYVHQGYLYHKPEKFVLNQRK